MNDKVRLVDHSSNQPRSYADIEQQFNHSHFTAEATAGLMFEVANHHIKINDKIACSATYAVQAAVTDMQKAFDELLSLYLKEKEAAFHIGDYA